MLQAVTAGVQNSGYDKAMGTYRNAVPRSLYNNVDNRTRGTIDLLYISYRASFSWSMEGADGFIYMVDFGFYGWFG